MSEENSVYGKRNDRDPKCPLCSDGWLDDGGNYGTCYVPCPCTGKASADIVKKVISSYPKMKDFLGE